MFDRVLSLCRQQVFPCAACHSVYAMSFRVLIGGQFLIHLLISPPLSQCMEMSLKAIVSLAIALIAAGTAIATPAYAIDSRIVRQLNALDPQERREQRCDIEAMTRIAKAGEGFRPDKVIAYTRADIIEKGDDLRAPGAVFRSAGDWYKLKFKCRTGDEGLSVVSFDYKIGAKIPRSEWDRLYLYD